MLCLTEALIPDGPALMAQIQHIWHLDLAHIWRGIMSLGQFVPFAQSRPQAGHSIATSAEISV